MKPFAAREDSVSPRCLPVFLRLFICAALALFTLTACSFGDASGSGRGPAPPAAPQAAEVAPQPSTMDTFRALAPPEGLKFVPLFAEPVSDEDARFRRLEEAVQSIKNDFDTVTPSIVRLVAIEKDIKELVGQLETLTDGSVAAEPVEPVDALPLESKFNEIPREDIAGGTETVAAQAAAVPTADASRVTPEAALEGELPPEGAASPSSTTSATPAAPPPSVPLDLKPIAPAAAPAPAEAPVPATAGPVLGDIRGVRIGDHKDKTRIVLDMSAKPAYSAALSADGKQLTIDLPQMNFVPAKNWEALTAALVAGYRFENGRLILDLLYPSQIKLQEILAPNGNANYRLVIDLFAPGTHQP